MTLQQGRGGRWPSKRSGKFNTLRHVWNLRQVCFLGGGGGGEGVFGGGDGVLGGGEGILGGGEGVLGGGGGCEYVLGGAGGGEEDGGGGEGVLGGGRGGENVLGGGGGGEENGGGCEGALGGGGGGESDGGGGKGFTAQWKPAGTSFPVHLLINNFNVRGKYSRSIPSASTSRAAHKQTAASSSAKS